MKIWLLSGIFFLAGGLQQAAAHCQIPCGIYGDDARFTLIREDIRTIEKSMNQINTLSEQPSKNSNQLVRWVNNKEEHANKIKQTVSEYFLAQRIKEPKDKANKKALNTYHKKLHLLHRMTVSSMKAKQTTDLKHVESLRAALDEFEKLYSAGKKK